MILNPSINNDSYMTTMMSIIFGMFMGIMLTLGFLRYCMLGTMVGTLPGGDGASYYRYNNKGYVSLH